LRWCLSQKEGGEEAMSKVLDQLAEYIDVLGASADTTRRAEDRPLYDRHLAAAARMFVAAHRDPKGADLRRLVEDERRAFGWSFVSGDEGNRAESAFNVFADTLLGGK
jgi:hypothetical protein